MIRVDVTSSRSRRRARAARRSKTLTPTSGELDLPEDARLRRGRAVAVASFRLRRLWPARGKTARRVGGRLGGGSRRRGILFRKNRIRANLQFGLAAASAPAGVPLFGEFEPSGPRRPKPAGAAVKALISFKTAKE